MRIFLIGLTVIAAAAAASISSEYLPPVADNSLSQPQTPSQEYIPPAAAGSDAGGQSQLADDGYRYKVVRRLRFRHRRDVNELPSNEYLPPTEAASEDSVAIEAPAAAAPETVKADDGYRYKVVRRIRYRRRRDAPANEYLPPAEETASAAQETAVIAVEEPAETVKDDSGYRYKTVRRIRYRHRRDVNELPSNEYLPPTEESASAQESAVVAVEEPAETVKDASGYRYKTVRRIRYRRRRDVNELPSNEYLPPTEESGSAAQESAVVAVEEPAETVKDASGYRYKTVRRIRYRRRRDVNELPANEYLPPTQESSSAQESVIVEAPETVKGADGYRYKVVRRLKYRRH